MEEGCPYLFDAGSDRVSGWTSQRLPFEPKGWLLEYRCALRKRLSAMAAGEGLLVAELATPADAFFDIENVLFYNVGTSSMKHLARRGVAFRRVVAGAVPPELQPGPSPTRVSYATAPRPVWLEEDPVRATFDIALPRLNSSTKPHEVWWSTRVHDEGGPPVAGPYGLSLRVSPPRDGHRSNPVSYMKPLLDGVIAAMQVGPPPVDEAVARLAARLGESDDRVLERLERGASVIEGDGALVRPRGEGIQWNPADDRCTAVVLEVVPAGGEGWQVRGEVRADALTP